MKNRSISEIDHLFYRGRTTFDELADVEKTSTKIIDICQHPLQESQQCIGCDKHICPLCDGAWSTVCCNDCATQEMNYI